LTELLAGRRSQKEDEMFLNQWKGAGIAGLKSDFEIDDAALDGVNVLLARYATGSY
jgi:hypothetical protein